MTYRWNITTEEYIERARSVHGDKYSYELTNYVDRNTFITITCPVHGPIKVNPYTHIRLKTGCSLCALDKTKKTCTLTQELFIERAKEYIGSHYDYSRVKYVNAHTPVIIGCPIHGWFTKLPMEIQNQKRGCPKCGLGKRDDKRRTGVSDFVKRSNIIHHNKYNYDKVIYVNQQTNVTISCPKHGDFNQRPLDHLKGKGCPLCRNSHFESIIQSFLMKHDIRFKKEHTFSWLKRKSLLKLDFYLPEYNIAIECQGAQHFGMNSTRFDFMSEEDYKDTRSRDELKYNLCKEHGIRILYFCYNKEWIPDNYIDHVYTTVKELLVELKRIKN